ncbi:CRAL-TRIO domain-containing protein [Chytriomyces sp. MP71]|nr:CRAL-TRIO domain-containing protein [Chytriomyces sp. MP71]
MSSLSELLVENKGEIATLRALIADVLNTSTHDDVWLLRYILSNKTAAGAEEACRYTISWFNENEFIVNSIMRDGQKAPFADLINKYQVIGDHGTTKEGEPLFFVRVGLSNPKALMDNVAYADVLNFMILNRLQVLADCDAASRKQDKLIKFITVLDMQGMSLSKIPDSRFLKVLGESSKMSEKMFPQLLGKTIYANAPSWMAWAFNTALKPLISQKTAAKTVFCPGKTSGKSISDCPYMTRYLQTSEMPTFMGGRCDCPGGCIGGVPNSQTTPITNVSDDGSISLNISSRNTEVASFHVLAGSRIKCVVKIAPTQNIQARMSIKRQESGKEMEIVAKKTLEGPGKKSTNENENAWMGDIKADADGVFMIEFDNSSSWMKSKTVTYSVDISMPGIEE